MKKIKIIIPIILLILLVVITSQSFSQKNSPVDVMEIINDIDEMSNYDGDFKAKMTLIQQKINENTKEKEKTVKIAEIYRKDEDDKFMIIFTSPKTEAGKGYLLIDDNLWFYDSNSREFSKKTNSESIGGTDAKQRDIEKKNLSDLFNWEYFGEGKVGKIDAYMLIGRAKDKSDLEYPVTKMWVNKKNHLPVKREEYSVSAMKSKDLSDKKPSQTIAYLKYTKLKDKKGEEVTALAKYVVINNREKGRMTIGEFDDIELVDLPDNIFTKAYLENRSN